jgi:hypothetical protein
MFPVRYKPNLCILFGINPVFKGLTCFMAPEKLVNERNLAYRRDEVLKQCRILAVKVYIVVFWLGT